ncbi:hypothetical protein [Ferruginibacter sp. SUN106]|uniref:hypothetical protein n=1 Tax=Ferruginibacter sp. SUN106 TaxID=2978348 RepID=UPI003D369DCA
MKINIILRIFIGLSFFYSCSKSDSGTPNPPPAPVVTAPVVAATTGVTGITATTAISGGNVTADGGAAITAKGICWSTATNPTIADNKTNEGTAIGTFTSTIAGLTVNTVYYVRAYATNATGTTYGTAISFKTSVDIGTTFQGGILAYILMPADPGYDPQVQHGLIVAPTDQGNTISWDNGLRHSTGATGTAIGTGDANTTKIIATEGAGNYAARLCYDLVLNGYSDWYLPSKDELIKLYINQARIGAFFPYHYWSSSESSASYFDAWTLRFDGANNPAILNKNYALIVRAIRSY